MVKSLFRNAFFKGVLSVFNIVVPILVIPYVYRILTPDAIGYIEYGTTLYTYFGLLGALGIYNYGVREISKHRDDPAVVKKMFCNLFTIGIISNILVLFLYLLTILTVIKTSPLLLIMLVLSGNLVANIFYVEWMNEANEEFFFITIKTIIIRLVSVVFIFLLVREPVDYLTYVIIITGVLFFNNIVSFWYVCARMELNWKFSWTDIEWRKYLAPLFFILILNNSNLLYTMMDKLMLGYYCNIDEVAYYGVGQKIMDIVRGLLMTIVFVSMPRLAYHLEENISIYKAGILKIIRMMLLLTLPVAVGIILLSEEIVLLFAGAPYLSAVPVLQVFAFRVIVTGVEAILTQQIIFLHGKERILVVYNLMCGGLNVALNFAFLSVLTPFVAICTTVISELCFQCICFWYIKHRLGIHTGIWNKANLNYVALSLAFIPVVLVFREIIPSHYLYVGISIVSCGIIYCGGLWLIKDTMFIETVNRILKIK